MSTSASPPGRSTPTITPVEVSLWAQATTSAPGSPAGAGAEPGSASMHHRVGQERRRRR